MLQSASHIGTSDRIGKVGTMLLEKNYNLVLSKVIITDVPFDQVQFHYMTKMPLQDPPVSVLA